MRPRRSCGGSGPEPPPRRGVVNGPPTDGSRVARLVRRTNPKSRPLRRSTGALAAAGLALCLVASPAETQSRVGDFRYVPATDAMTDRDLSYISTVALGGMEGDPDAHLSWRCSGSTIELILRAPELENVRGPIPVRWRFDRDPASGREAWRVSSLEPVASAPEETIYPFSEIASTASTVLIRAEDGQGRVHDYRFSLRGLNNALNRLECVRHLEILGERRALALFERAAIGVEREGSGYEISTLIEEFPFVGHRTQRRYLASKEGCWRTLWSVDEVVFFRTERDARSGGFARVRDCAP